MNLRDVGSETSINDSVQTNLLDRQASSVSDEACW